MNADWVMVIITGVYVIATIFICWANIKAANASKEQLREMQKQFAETNRPIIELEFHYSRRTWYIARFVNRGNLSAQHVKINLDQEFIDSLPEESMKKVKVLSGGERTRLAMIKLLLEPVNLLILDEPTNHLDLKTKDILKQALKDFDGTLIVVSHDRDFLDGLVTKVYEFGNQKVTEHLCGIYEFLDKKKMDSLRELEK